MPLFKKKKNTSGTSGGAKQQPAAYPTQSPPSQSGAGQAPPPYQGQPAPQSYPGGQPYSYPPPAQGYNVQQQAQPVHAPPYSQYPQQQVTAAGLFDQGARFDPNKPVSIPPPPPGVAPTTAQIAASQGQSVVMSQQRGDVWGGGSDGGYTLF